MIQVYKETFSELQVYRYRVTDEANRTLYLVEPTGLFLPNPTLEITVWDADRTPIGRIEPPDPSQWPWGGTYTVVLEGQEAPLVIIQEQWEMVDLLLLRLPRYLFRWEGQSYIARGHRFGEQFYHIFPSPPPSGETGQEVPGGVPADAAELDLEKLEEVAEQEISKWGEPAGVIRRPVRGPHYQAEAWAPPLQKAHLLLTALVVLADLHLQETRPQM